MLRPVFTTRFKKDLKRMQKRGADIEKFKQIATKLISLERLQEKHYDHRLSGNFEGRRECHIEPDWLLIYKLEEFRIIFERTGTHSDLFS